MILSPIVTGETSEVPRDNRSALNDLHNPAHLHRLCR